MSEWFPKAGSSRNECKEFIRRNVAGVQDYDSHRAEFWPLLPRVNKEDSEIYSVRANSRKSELFGEGNKLGSMSVAKSRADQRYDIIMAGEVADVDAMDEREKVNFITGLLNRQFHMPEVGFVIPLITIVLQTIGDFKLALTLVWDLLEKPITYFHLSIKSYQIFVHAFKENLADVMPRTTARLNEIGALKRQFLDECFVHFFLRLLPTEDVRRMIDCYLIEGWKVQMRYAVALFTLHKKDIKEGRQIPGRADRVPFSSGEEFWTYLRSCRDKKGLYGTALVAQAYEEPRFGNLFKVLHVPRQTLLGLVARCERSLEWSAEEEEEYAEPVLLEGYLPGTGDPNSSSNEGGGTWSVVGSSKGVLSTQQALSLGSFVSSLVAESDILTRETASVLAPHIPETAQLEGFSRVYCSPLHGLSLDALYSLSANLNPCILVIQGYSPSVPGVKPVLGMFLTESLAPDGYVLTTAGSKSSRSTVRGSHLCFCFRLDGEHASVHTPASPGVDSGTVVEGHDSASRSQNFTVTQYFSSSTKDGIVAGGSSKHMSNALRIDAELDCCHSGPSDTYRNSTGLLPEFCSGTGVTGSVQIASVEVLCGKHSVDTALRTGVLVLSADNKLQLRRAGGSGPNVDSYIHKCM